MSLWQNFPARIVAGHRVASGLNGDPRFPGGTLRMQAPRFRARGFDLSPFHPGTLNVGIAPLRYRVVAPRLTLRDVRWHQTEPAEDFSFFDVRLFRTGAPAVDGVIYFPHPETKPAHFQADDVLELLLPFTPGLAYGASIEVATRPDQIAIEAGRDGAERESH